MTEINPIKVGSRISGHPVIMSRNLTTLNKITTQAEAPRRFFRDPASLCEKILLSSSADVDVDLLVSFSAFVSSPAGRPLVAGRFKRVASDHLSRAKVW